MTTITDRLLAEKVHAALVDTDHAVALEREAIIRFLQAEMQGAYDSWESGQNIAGQDIGNAFDIAWQDIAQGRHHQEGE